MRHVLKIYDTKYEAHTPCSRWTFLSPDNSCGATVETGVSVEEEFMLEEPIVETVEGDSVSEN